MTGIDFTFTPDVTKDNPEGILYTYGNEDKDGSVRQTVGADPLNVRFSARASGVWNLTGAEISGATLHLNFDLRAGAAGEDLHLSNADDTLLATVPKFQYNDEIGSFPYPTATRQQPLRPKVIFQPDFSVDSLLANHAWVAPPSTDNLRVKAVWLKVGAVSATEQVTVDFYHGSDDTGINFFTQNYPPEQFTAGTEILLPLTSLVDIKEGNVVYHEIKSDVAFSLLGNAALVPWHGHADYLISDENLMTFETGLDKVITSCITGEVMIDSRGNLMTIGAPK